MKKTKQKIKIIQNGPYEITGSLPLAQEFIRPDKNGDSKDWQKGKAYDCGENYSLCRCGHSQNKPFCDGTHSEINFDGEETASKSSTAFDDTAKVYIGDDLILRDCEELCAVARFCEYAQGVWELSIHSADPENKEKAKVLACSCPSGRLTLTEVDGTPIEVELDPSISLTEDIKTNHRGPLWIKGGILIESASGEAYESRNRATLCRCGESENKPFCDASHLSCSHMKGLDKI